jgi:putative aminopeptidase FrvX
MEILRKLCEINGLSGDEAQVTQYIMSQLRSTSCEMFYR